MNFSNPTTLDVVLNTLFEKYRAGVPDVEKITNAMIEKGIIQYADDIVNDHIAFRTLGVPHLGIASFEKIFLQQGYTRRDAYYFQDKKLNAFWYAPPAPVYPRIFISELRVKDLSAAAQTILQRYTEGINADPVDALDLNNGAAIGAFLHTPLWQLPTKSDYQTLLAESEYAAWVLYNRYYLNHYTISVHALGEGYNTLEGFNTFLESIGVRLNDAGGKIKRSPDGLLLQSSSVAKTEIVQFACGGTLEIAGSYVEFAERRPLPTYAHLAAHELTREQRREGFEAANADKIFESTYVEQTLR